MANPHPVQLQPEEHHPFHPRDALKSGTRGGVAGGVVGLFAAAVQNSLSKQNVGAWGVLTRHGGTVASLGVYSTYRLPFALPPLFSPPSPLSSEEER